MFNRWKIILIATGFNLLFEYSLRGINNLKAQPFLPFILFPIYLTLFTMVEDLIVRFKLKAYQLMILAFFYGTIYGTFTSGIVFINPTIFGIAWIPFLSVNIVWWGTIQAVITFYFANLISPRDWYHPQMSRAGWITCIVITIAALIVFQKSGLIPGGTPIGQLTIFTIMIISFCITIFSINKSGKKTHAFVKDRFFTIISITTVIIFLFSAIFLTHDPILSNTSNVNASSLKIISTYTLVISILLLIYRVISKKEISV